MKRIQKTVEIELTKDECLVLYKAEKLLEAMKKEVAMIATPIFENDLDQIEDCLDHLKDVTARYSVHSTLEIYEEV
jgi:hypothetical protein